MMKRYLLQSAAAAAILLAGGCSGSSTNNDQVGAENAAGNALTGNEMAADEDTADAAVSVAPPPAAPAGLSSEDAAPLSQATQIASEIDSAPDVERVPFEGGWAWRRHGQIVRTSSRDGRRISYFRPGESAPFFVQQGEQSFAYSGGQVRRAYDRGGHAAPIAPQRRDEAQRLADQSRHDRSQAEHAPAPPHRQGEADRANRRDRSSNDHAAAHSGQAPSDGNSASEASGRGHDGNAATDRRRDRRPADDSTNRTGRRDP
jgi:hypothetical protein